MKDNKNEIRRETCLIVPSATTSKKVFFKNDEVRIIKMLPGEERCTEINGRIVNIKDGWLGIDASNRFHSEIVIVNYKDILTILPLSMEVEMKVESNWENENGN